MKKVLIISYYWPPNAGVGCRRWVNYSDCLQKKGIEPILYVPNNPNYLNKDDGYQDKLKNICTLKNKIWEPFSIYKTLFNKKNINPGVLIDSNKGFKNRFSKWVRANFFIPDARCLWINSSIKYLSNFLIDNPVDAIISTGPPHSMHLIALNLKKRFNLKWIADFRDPWTDIEYFDRLNFFNDSKKRHIKFEKEVLKKADLVLTVSESWSKRFNNLGAKKVEFLFNGFDKTQYSFENNHNKKFRIGHFGLYNQLRDHNSFWTALNSILKEKKIFSDNLELFFSGPVHLKFHENIKNRGVSKYLKHHDWLTHKDVMQEMIKTDLLLLTHANTKDVKGRLPAKFFEYLGSRKPILAIGEKTSDLSKLITELNCGVFFDFEDTKGIEKALLKYFDDYLNDNKHNVQEDLDVFSWENQSNKLIQILKSL